MIVATAGFGDRLKEILSTKNINANELSKMSGVAYSTIHELLSGVRKDTSTTKASQIAKALNVSVAELISDNEKKEENQDLEKIRKFRKGVLYLKIALGYNFFSLLSLPWFSLKKSRVSLL